MTRDEAKQLLPIIQAYANGEEVQYRDLDGEWQTFATLSFGGSLSRYRIKPKPEVIYVNLYKNGQDLRGVAYPTEQEARSYGVPGRLGTKKFIEVMDESAE